MKYYNEREDYIIKFIREAEKAFGIEPVNLKNVDIADYYLYLVEAYRQAPENFEEPHL